MRNCVLNFRLLFSELTVASIARITLFTVVILNPKVTSFVRSSIDQSVL